MLAHHGLDLARLAETGGIALKYEAAVAGGIPVIKGMREGAAANEIARVYGILNGTCNYILTTMEKEGRGFDDVLKEAQELGFAEADPSFDIDGVDAAHKLTILASLAFGTELDFDSIAVPGIRHVIAADIAAAAALVSKPRTFMPPRASVAAIPGPMVPMPITATFFISNSALTSPLFGTPTVHRGRSASAANAENQASLLGN